MVHSIVNRSAVSAALLAALSFAASAEPSKTVVDYREHMFDAPVRSLANRTMDLMFNTAPVEKGEEVSPLPAASARLDFTYSYRNVTHQAEDVIEDTDTDALLILKDGRIAYETYRNRSDAHTRFNSYSMAKSINAILLGLALEDGAVKSIDDPITDYLPELKGSGYDGATIREIVEMRSGVAWNDNFFDPKTQSHKAHILSWVEEKQRYADEAPHTRRAHPPGQVFNYNTMDAGVIGLLVERAVKQPISSYLSEKIWKPGGMESRAFYVIDGPPGIGREFSGGGFNAVLRDYGRLGLLMADRGLLNGKQLLPAAYVAEASAPSTKSDRETDEPGFGYGYFWWPVLGTSAFTAWGGEGQFIYVDPSTRTVIVKLSHGPVGAPAVPKEGEALAFFSAASSWRPPEGR